jgi:hypothetical protein
MDIYYKKEYSVNTDQKPLLDKETKIHTREDGYNSVRFYENQIVNVLSLNQEWKTVMVKSILWKCAMYEVTLSNQTKLICSSNYQWKIKNQYHRFVLTETQNLKINDVVKNFNYADPYKCCGIYSDDNLAQEEAKKSQFSPIIYQMNFDSINTFLHHSNYKKMIVNGLPMISFEGTYEYVCDLMALLQRIGYCIFTINYHSLKYHLIFCQNEKIKQDEDANIYYIRSIKKIDSKPNRYYFLDDVSNLIFDSPMTECSPQCPNREKI